MFAKRSLVGVMTFLVAAGVGGAGTAATKKKPLVDRKPPTIRITSPDDQIVLSTRTKDVSSNLSGQVPFGGTLISGVANDTLSGVKAVTVSFKACRATDYNNPGPATCGTGASPGLEQQNHPCANGCGSDVQLTCDKTRRNCTWGVYAPIYPGVYIVNAAGTDKMNNRGRAAPVNILIV